MSDKHITIPIARLIELETAEHERNILRADLNAMLVAESERIANEPPAPKAADAQHPTRAPLTDEQIDAGVRGNCVGATNVIAFYIGVRFAERAHGITGEGGNG